MSVQRRRQGSGGGGGRTRRGGSFARCSYQSRTRGALWRTLTPSDAALSGPSSCARAAPAPCVRWLGCNLPPPTQEH